ncbi:MAG TPA: DotH/IcmK family type IV secretion protein [Gammaproteobacteria bacterium]|nr:DotH/IcmK family type IV secretion protein [Gammaproteobacteria bacterium]
MRNFIKIIKLTMMLILACAWQSGFAVELTPASPTTPFPTPADIARFQTWLKNNGQPVQTATKAPIEKREAPIIDTPPLSYQDSQAMMLKTAPPSPPPSEESTEAFNAMTQQNIPLTPQQVIKLRQLIDASQRAASIPATVPPKPVSTTLMVNLAPGATPPAIRLAQGYVTSLVFVDSTGSPWPVASYDIGDPKTTNIQWDGKSNILLIQAISPYGDSDLVIRLNGLPTPITLELVAGQRVVDYRTDIHVPGIGPNTKDLPIGTQLPNSANQLLLNVLDGVAPGDSKQLTVMGGDCQAWLLGDKMYLRTRLTVLSPGWIGRMVSPDGMMAYEIQKSSSVLVSQYGQPIELNVEGF